MKKFIVGVLCGVTLSAVTAVSAAAPIQTYLTKATIGLHMNGIESRTQENEVELLTYKDRIYVPLRWFSEKMGSTVDYLPINRGRGYHLPHIDLYSESSSYFTITDATKSVSIGHVEVNFNEAPVTKGPTINGVIKLLKPIGNGKEVVLEVKDKGGLTVAQTEYIKAGGRYDTMQTESKSLSEFKVGEVRAFNTNLSFVPPLQNYEVSVKIVDSTPWRFKQVGTYAQQETPFDVGLLVDKDISTPVKAGSVITFTAMITNSTSKSLKVINAPFEMLIGSAGKTIWTHKFVPLEQTVLPGHYGAMVISVPWKASVPAGEYGVGLETPVTVQYEEDGELKTVAANTGVFTNVMFPITIKK